MATKGVFHNKYIRAGIGLGWGEFQQTDLSHEAPCPHVENSLELHVTLLPQ